MNGINPGGPSDRARVHRTCVGAGGVPGLGDAVDRIDRRREPAGRPEPGWKVGNSGAHGPDRPVRRRVHVSDDRPDEVPRLENPWRGGVGPRS